MRDVNKLKIGENLTKVQDIMKEAKKQKLNFKRPTQEILDEIDGD